jgi:hypothetical protein
VYHMWYQSLHNSLYSPLALLDPNILLCTLIPTLYRHWDRELEKVTIYSVSFTPYAILKRNDKVQFPFARTRQRNCACSRHFDTSCWEAPVRVGTLKELSFQTPFAQSYTLTWRVSRRQY